MKRLVLTALLCAWLTAAASAQPTDLTNGRVWSTSALAYASTLPTTSWQFGSVLDCRSAASIVFYISAGPEHGATTSSAVAVEWLLDDPRSPASGGPYANVTYWAGDRLSSSDGASSYSIKGLLFAWRDEGTTGVKTIVSMGRYRASALVVAPFCRFAVKGGAADGDNAKVMAWYALRYQPMQLIDTIRALQHGAGNGTDGSFSP